jgi:hypothetical protein
MKNEIAIKVHYRILGKSDSENYGEDELDKFQQRIQNEYLVIMKKSIAERGGGNFLIEFLLGLTLKDYLMVIAGGVGWDLVKIGTKKFLLQPFIKQYRKFRETEYSQEIRDIAFTFSDTKLNILSIIPKQPEVNFVTIARIFQSLAKVYNQLDSDPNNKLIEISIPIFRDDFTSDKVIYREKLEVDEPLHFEHNQNIFNEHSYLKYWGLTFSNFTRKVFDFEAQSIINETWLTDSDFTRTYGI